jgi:anti-sigma B factor antagonist
MRELAIAGELVIAREHQGNAVVLACSGELDMASAPALERELLDAESAGPARIVVDLSGVEFMDSTGLHLLLSAHKRSLERHHKLSLVRGPRPVHRVFELTGTVDAFSFEDEDWAVDRPGNPADGLTNPGNPPAYTTGNDVHVFTLESATDAEDIRTIGERISAVTSEGHSRCVVVDTTGTHVPDRPSLAAALVRHLDGAVQGDTPLAVVSTEAEICDALRRSTIAHLVVAPTVKQALETCGSS